MDNEDPNTSKPRNSDNNVKRGSTSSSGSRRGSRGSTGSKRASKTVNLVENNVESKTETTSNIRAASVASNVGSEKSQKKSACSLNQKCGGAAGVCSSPSCKFNRQPDAKSSNMDNARASGSGKLVVPQRSCTRSTCPALAGSVGRQANASSTVSMPAKAVSSQKGCTRSSCPHLKPPNAARSDGCICMKCSHGPGSSAAACAMGVPSMSAGRQQHVFQLGSPAACGVCKDSTQILFVESNFLETPSEYEVFLDCISESDMPHEGSARSVYKRPDMPDKSANSTLYNSLTSRQIPQTSMHVSTLPKVVSNMEDAQDFADKLKNMMYTSQCLLKDFEEARRIQQRNLMVDAGTTPSLMPSPPQTRTVMLEIKAQLNTPDQRNAGQGQMDQFRLKIDPVAVSVPMNIQMRAKHREIGDSQESASSLHSPPHTMAMPTTPLSNELEPIRTSVITSGKGTPPAIVPSPAAIQPDDATFSSIFPSAGIQPDDATFSSTFPSAGIQPDNATYSSNFPSAGIQPVNATYPSAEASNKMNSGISCVCLYENNAIVSQDLSEDMTKTAIISMRTIGSNGTIYKDLEESPLGSAAICSMAVSKCHPSCKGFCSEIPPCGPPHSPPYSPPSDPPTVDDNIDEESETMTESDSLSSLTSKPTPKPTPTPPPPPKYYRLALPQHARLRLCTPCRFRPSPLIDEDGRVFCPGNCGCCLCPWRPRKSLDEQEQQKHSYYKVCKCRERGTIFTSFDRLDLQCSNRSFFDECPCREKAEQVFLDLYNHEMSAPNEEILKNYRGRPILLSEVQEISLPKSRNRP